MPFRRRSKQLLVLLGHLVGQRVLRAVAGLVFEADDQPDLVGVRLTAVDRVEEMYLSERSERGANTVDLDDGGGLRLEWRRQASLPRAPKPAAARRLPTSEAPGVGASRGFRPPSRPAKHREQMFETGAVSQGADVPQGLLEHHAWPTRIDIAAVQKMAGHASVSTAGEYDRRDHSVQRKVVAPLDVPYLPPEE